MEILHEWGSGQAPEPLLVLVTQLQDPCSVTGCIVALGVGYVLLRYQDFQRLAQHNGKELGLSLEGYWEECSSYVMLSNSQQSFLADNVIRVIPQCVHKGWRDAGGVEQVWYDEHFDFNLLEARGILLADQDTTTYLELTKELYLQGEYFACLCP